MARAKNDDFRKLRLASAISQLGDGAMLVAIPLVAAELTGSAGQVAAITVAALGSPLSPSYPPQSADGPRSSRRSWQQALRLPALAW